MGDVNSGSNDRIQRNVEKGDHEEEMSPMAPPEAYAPPGAGQSVPYADMHPLLKELRDEHEVYLRELDVFEGLLAGIRVTGIDAAAGKGLGRFFRLLEDDVLPHNRREERVLFPLLAQRLVESGEHSPGPRPTTGVDVMLADHVTLIQQSAVALGFLRIADRLSDEGSKQIVIDEATKLGLKFASDLRLHIFREDEVIFALAHQLITPEELDQLHQLPL